MRDRSGAAGFGAEEFLHPRSLYLIYHLDIGQDQLRTASPKQSDNLPTTF
jgi:hypothetical protein